MGPSFPIPPLPPREFFSSSDEYLRAKNRHRQLVEDRNRRAKWDAAIVIAIGVTFGAVAVLTLAALLFVTWGWRGPAFALAAAGLFWAFVIEIHKRL